MVNFCKGFLLTALFCVILSCTYNSVQSFSITKTFLNQLRTSPSNPARSVSNSSNRNSQLISLSAAAKPASLSGNNKDPASTPPYTLTLPQQVYVFLTTLFVTCLITADVIGVKIFEIKLPFPILGHSSIEHTCGMLTFPITFLLGDIINEYYGAKATKQTVYLGLFMSVLVFIIMNIAQAMPYLDKSFNVSKFAFDQVFGTAKLMYIASIVAYFFGQMLDIWLFGVIKRLTKGKYLWIRATGSTLISQLMDSFVVSYIAFRFGKIINKLEPATMKEVFGIAVTGYTLKFVIAGLITPLLYFTRNILHDKFGLEPLPLDYKEDGDNSTGNPAQSMAVG